MAPASSSRKRSSMGVCLLCSSDHKQQPGVVMVTFLPADLDKLNPSGVHAYVYAFLSAKVTMLV